MEKIETIQKELKKHLIRKEIPTFYRSHEKSRRISKAIWYRC